MKQRAMNGNWRASGCWNLMLVLVNGARQVLIWIDGCFKFVLYKVCLWILCGNPRNGFHPEKMPSAQAAGECTKADSRWIR